MHVPAPATEYDRLVQVTAGDLVTGSPVVISAAASMHETARLLALHSIGVVPVVDENGACIGIIGARDFIAYELDRTGDATFGARAANLSTDGTPLLPCFSVRRYMSTGVQSVASDACIKRVIEILLGGRIHHLVVLDRQARPLGVLSTLDCLAAVNAIDDEQRLSPKR